MADFLRKLKQLNQILHGRRKTAAVVCLITLLTAVIESFGLSMILPIMQVAVKGSLEGRLEKILGPLVSVFPKDLLLPVLCGIFLILLVIKFAGKMAYTIISRRFVWKLRLDWINLIFSKYLYSEYTYLINNRQGVLLTNLIDETYRGAICLSQLVELIGKVILLVCLYITLLLINWRVTFFLSLVVGGLFITTQNITKQFAQKTGKRRLTFKQKLFGWAAEGIGGGRQIKILGLEQFFKNRFSVIAYKLYNVELRFEIIKKMLTSMDELLMGAILVAAIFYNHFFSKIPINSLLPILGVFIIVGQKMFGNISQLVGLRLQVITLLPSLSLSYDLSEMAISQENLHSGAKLEKITDDIIFRDVTFGYNPQQKIFSHLDLIVPQGKMTAIIGQSGTGKSTLADILLGIYSPENGQILVNGFDLQNWQLASWRSRISYVSQEPYLFNMTIRENIAISAGDVSENEIENAARQAYAHDFIISFPKGYDTIVGDRGVKLSGGQRQRIAIARAIIRDPDLFVFDEATSALDNESEKKVQKAIEKIAENKTILVIAHRLSTIEKADIVYDLDEIC